MFCSNCGVDIQAGSTLCDKCGQETTAPVMAGTTQPSNTPPWQNAALWNPDAASNWCLIFSPIFGSYLHAINWRTLGEPEKERYAMRWFYFSLVVLVGCTFWRVFNELSGVPYPGRGASGLALLYLFVWYFSAGRAQAKYVKERFGSKYPRRSWVKPLLIGVAAVIGYSVLTAFFATVWYLATS